MDTNFSDRRWLILYCQLCTNISIRHTTIDQDILCEQCAEVCRIEYELLDTGILEAQTDSTEQWLSQQTEQQDFSPIESRIVNNQSDSLDEGSLIDPNIDHNHNQAEESNHHNSSIDRSNDLLNYEPPVQNVDEEIMNLIHNLSNEDRIRTVIGTGTGNDSYHTAYRIIVNQDDKCIGQMIVPGSRSLERKNTIIANKHQWVSQNDRAHIENLDVSVSVRESVYEYLIWRNNLLYLSFRRYYSNHLAESEDPDNTWPASRQAVEGLPIVKITYSNFERDNETQQLEPPLCPICTQDICLGDNGMFMPWVHLFHPNWLREWLESQNTWPVCRCKLPVEEE